MLWCSLPFFARYVQLILVYFGFPADDHNPISPSSFFVHQHDISLLSLTPRPPVYHPDNQPSRMHNVACLGERLNTSLRRECIPHAQIDC